MKSQVNMYVDLLEHMLRCDPSGLESLSSLKRDIQTLRTRYLHEGLSFLTKTLPRLGRALDTGLTSLRFNLPREFQRSHESASRPAFLQVYFKRIFDDSGFLLEDADPYAIRHVRQVCFFAYKLETPFSSAQLKEAFNQFVQVDGALKPIDDVESLKIIEVASHITEDVFGDFDHMNIIPRHGPGAVATGEKLEDKWEFSRLYDPIHQVYPYYDYFIVGGANELLDRKKWYMELIRLDQGRAKTVAVPKDSRGPRLISAEPLEYQWIQQGLGRKIMEHLETNNLTRGNINFTLQSVNQALALESSTSRANATIDLKDASDRVSLELVEKVFSRTPTLLRALKACRTSSTLLPDGRIVEMQKYAPMGSALCFPVESFVFWVLLVAAISRWHALHDSKERRTKMMREVYVYGDDIIVPTRYASLCIQTLEAVNLRVNRQKCCIQGHFRESCGVDAFKGINVTPIRLKAPWSGRQLDGSAYASYVSIANSLSERNYGLCAEFLWGVLEKTYGLIPYGTSRASYPCRLVSDPVVAEARNLRLFRKRNSGRYQRVEFMLKRLKPYKLPSKLNGWPRLLRNMVSGAGEDPSNVVLPRSTVIKRGWTATF